MRIAVIGAGISGLACADGLRRAGYDVTVFEKSRGIGGRLSTRRTPENLRFDHGAQFFTVRAKVFRQFLAGEARRWPAAREFALEADWFIGAPDMKSFLRPVAQNLKVQLETRVEHIERSDAGWELSSGDESLGNFDQVIITAPSPQVQALTGFSAHMQAALSSVKMAPCWAIMLTLANPAGLDHDVFSSRDDKLAWLARNSSKIGRAEAPECWVAHASSEWSAEHLELSRDEVLKTLLPDICQLLETSMDELIYFSAHRWRYAKVLKPLGEAFLQDETGTVFAAGDWCLGARVEDAFISGFELARHIRDRKSKAA